MSSEISSSISSPTSLMTPWISGKRDPTSAFCAKKSGLPGQGEVRVRARARVRARVRVRARARARDRRAVGAGGVPAEARAERAGGRGDPLLLEDLDVAPPLLPLLLDRLLDVVHLVRLRVRGRVRVRLRVRVRVLLDVVHREVDVGLGAVDQVVDLALPVRAQTTQALLERLAERPLAGDGRLVRVRVRVRGRGRGRGRVSSG